MSPRRARKVIKELYADMAKDQARIAARQAAITRNLAKASTLPAPPDRLLEIIESLETTHDSIVEILEMSMILECNTEVLETKDGGATAAAGAD